MQSQTIVKETQNSSQKSTMHPQMSSKTYNDVATNILEANSSENQAQRLEIVELTKFSDKCMENEDLLHSSHEQHNQTHTEAMELCYPTPQDASNHLWRTTEKLFFDRKILALKNLKPFQQLEELKLSKSRLGWKEMMLITAERSHLIQLKILDLSDNYLEDRGIMVLAVDKMSWNSLENLNLAGNRFGTLGAKILSCNFRLISLKRLNLSRN